MRVINEDELQKCLSSGSKSRLRQFRRQLGSDRDKVIFDDQIAELVKRYAFNPNDVQHVIDYLNNLCDSEGKRYSQSQREYSKLVDQFNEFAKPNHTSFRWNRNYREALEWVKMVVSSELKLRQVNYSCDDDIIDIIPKSTTHSGFTYLETGRKKKGENMDDIFSRYSSFEEEARKVGSFNKCILPGTRTQGSGAFDDVTGEETGTCKHKTRLVSMIDLFIIIAELKFASPFQERFAKVEQYAGGKNNDEISIIINDWTTKYGQWYSLDYSHFDQTISDWLIRDAFDVIKSCFDLQSFDDELFGIVVDDFIHKNFITVDGVVHSDKGVPSGSMFTQIIDSIVNLICIKTYLLSLNIECQMMVMGDDNLLFTRFPIDITLMSTYLGKNFGLEMNPSKLKSGKCGHDFCCFLSREWRPGGCWRHPHVIISKLLYPERWRPYNTQEITPEMVLYGYWLAYPRGMSEFLNVSQFLADYDFSDERGIEKVASRYVPGALSFINEYTRTKGHGRTRRVAQS